MVSIAATSSATPSLQAALGRAKLAQAQSEASRAESNARQLRAQADDAEQQSQLSQTRVAQVASANSRQQANTYDTPSKTLSSRGSEVPVKVQNFIENLYRSTNPQRAASGNALKSNAESLPVVNSQGQATGRILNLIA